MDWYELTQLIGPTVVVCGVAAVFWRKFMKPWFVEQFGTPIEQRATAAAVQSIAATVQKELTLNGGGSIKDAVGEIRSNHARAQEHWEALEAGQAELNAGFAEINKRLRRFDDQQTEILETQERGRILLEAAFSVAPVEQQRVVTDAAAKLPPPKKHT